MNARVSLMDPSIMPAMRGIWLIGCQFTGSECGMRGSFGSTPMALPTLKRLTEVVVEGGGQLSVVLLGHPKLKNDLRRPQMEEIGDRTTVFEFGGLRDS